MSWQGLNSDFTGAVFDGGEFRSAWFSGGTVTFDRARFSGGTIDFSSAEFSGGMVYFGRARFSGGTIDFSGAQFSGGEVDFIDAHDWSFPPAFPWTDTPPSGVELPKLE